MGFPVEVWFLFCSLFDTVQVQGSLLAVWLQLGWTQAKGWDDGGGMAEVGLRNRVACSARDIPHHKKWKHLGSQQRQQ